MAQAASVLKPKVKDEEFDIGLKKAYRQQMAAALSDILADTYKLVIKSHIYHWNVVGPLFKPLHELTRNTTTHCSRPPTSSPSASARWGTWRRQSLARPISLRRPAPR